MTDFRALCAALLSELDSASDVLVGEGLWDGDDTDPAYDIRSAARAALAQPPEPAEGPSDDDLRIAFIEGAGFWLHGDSLTPGLRAVADLFTPRPAPIPVSERLPWPGDCDAEGRCWCYTPREDIDGVLIMHSRWILSRPAGIDTHWLPHEALPLPSTEG